MPKKKRKKNPKNWEVKSRKILIILFEMTKEFFVNDTTQESLWKFYDEHYRERVASTRKQFAMYKERDQIPPVFHICTIEGTISDSFTRKLEISKYFYDHGYKGLLGEVMEVSLEEFDPAKSEFYQSIKDIPFEEMCAPEKNLFPNFKKTGNLKRTPQSALPDDVHRVYLWMKDDEYFKYKEFAKKHEMSMSEYLLACARTGGIVKVNTKFLQEYENRLNECEQIFESMFLTFLMSNELYPADLRKLNEIKNEIAEINSEAKNTILNFYRQLNRLKTGEFIIKDQLE